MSQFYQGVTTGVLPPVVPIQFTTDAGVAVPAAGNLNVLANDSTANNANGITTTGSGDTVTVVLTNRLQGTGTTVGNTTTDLVTFSLGATPASYKFQFEVDGFDSVTPASVGYAIDASLRTDGVVSTIVGDPDADEDEDIVLQDGADWAIVASGNNVILRVTGVAGLSLSWATVGLYVKVQ